MVAGRRVYGFARRDPMEAHRDAVAMRSRALQVQDMPAAELARFGAAKTVREAAAAMHDELRATRAPGTVEFYELQERAVCRLISPDLPLERLTAQVLQILIKTAQARGLSARTIQHYRRWLHRLLKWAAMPQRQWFTAQIPTDLVSWPEPKATAPTTLDEGELLARLEQIRANPLEHALVLLMALTGLRRAEIARLRVADIDLQRQVIWVRGKVRDEAVPISEPIDQACRDLVAAATGEHVVAGENQTRRVQAIDRLFRRWAKRFGDRRFHPHALRHSLATNMIRRGVGAGVVQRAMRHSSYATTQRYVHLVASDVRDAVAQLRYVTGAKSLPKAEHG